MENQLKVMKVLWIFLTMSWAFFYFTAFQASQENPATNVDFTTDINAQIFVGMAVVSLVLSQIIPGFILKGASKNGNKIPLNFAFQAFMIRLAITEAVVLFGFVLANQHFDPTIMLPFMIVAFVRNFQVFPTQAKLNAWLEKYGFQLAETI